MSATPDSTLANPEQRIADLERQLAEREAELAERTAERDQAQQQETATAEVLEIINSSPGDLTPVFDAILEKAHTLCGASHGVLATYDGQYFRAVATHELPAPFTELLRQPFPPEPGGPQEQLLRGERLFHASDASVLTGPGWDTPRTRAAREAGLRAFLMLRFVKTGDSLATSRRIAVSLDRSRTSRSRCSKASRRRRSSRWRTRG